MAHQSVAGLCWRPHDTDLYQQVPLYNVRVDAALCDLSAEVKVHQTYVNNLVDEHAGPLECAYIFPLHEGSFVSAFAVQLDGVVIQGRSIADTQLQHRSEQDDDAALALKLSQFSGNIFHSKIGTLHPGSICTITLTYVIPLEQQGRQNRLTLPMIIAPPAAAIRGPTPSASPQPTVAPAPHNVILKGYYCNHCLCAPIIATRHPCSTCAQQQLCHRCHMQPNMSHPMLAQHAQYSSTPATSQLGNLSITLNITMPSPIISIECPSHPMDVKIQRPSDTSSNATASFHSNSMPSLSTDFILLVEQQRCFEPRIICELDMANLTAAVSLAFIPPPLDMLSSSQIRCELIFLLDCSGSMQGSSITCLRECMQIVLRSLPVNCRFNILVFGSTWSSLFPTSQSYDDASLSQASKYVSKLQADLRGTEICAPLLHALTTSLLPTHPRQVFLLTDGQVNNVEQLVQLASQHAVTTRLSTFGIGGSVDRSLCKKLAQAGRGKCEFITAEDGGGSAMRESVVRQVTKALQPMLTDVKVDWGQLLKADSTMSRQATSPAKSSSSSFLQCPSVAPAIGMTSRYVLYALNVSLPQIVWQKALARQKVDFRCEVIISAYSNHPLKEDHMHHSVMLTGEQITQAQVVHTLAAKERERELQDKLVLSSDGNTRKRIEDEILQMAKKHSLSSSFVLVHNPGTNKEMVKDMASLVHCPQVEDQQHINQSVPAAPPHLYSSAQNQAPPNPSTGPQLSTQVLHAGNIGAQLAVGSEGAAWLGAVQPWCPLCGRAQTGDLVGIEQSTANTAADLPTGLLQLGGMQRPWGKAEDASGTVIKDSTATSSESGNLKVMSSETDAKSSAAFEGLIQLQSANGAWPITPALIKSVHVIVPSSSSTVTMHSLEAISKKHGVDKAIVGVIMALHLLETHYKHRYVEWEMLATKAHYYVGQHGKVSADLLQEIKGSVAKLL